VNKGWYITYNKHISYNVTKLSKLMLTASAWTMALFSAFSFDCYCYYEYNVNVIKI